MNVPKEIKQAIENCSDDICESAMVKAIRRGMDNEAVYWSSQLFKRGKDHRVWRRLFIHVSEDIGLANKEMPSTILSLYNNYLVIKNGEKGKYEPDGAERLPLIHAVVLMARSKKSRAIDDAITVHFNCNEKISPPDYVIDYHSPLGRRNKRDILHFIKVASKIKNKAMFVRNKWSKKAISILLEKRDREEG